MVGATIALTWYCILAPYMETYHQGIIASSVLFWLMTASSLIAAGGYVINDIYDVEIDRINKPSKMIVGRSVSEKSAWRFYLILTSAGAVIGIYLGVLAGSMLFSVFFLIVIVSLWLYSAAFKKRFLTGNLLIAFLSATTVLITMVAFFLLDKDTVHFLSWFKLHSQMGYFIIAYAAFAFFTHLLRELVKDIEDSHGDKAFGSTTIPVIKGKQTAVKIAQGLNIFVLLGAVSVQILLFFHGFNMLAWVVFLVIGVIFFIMIQLRSAKHAEDFHAVGNVIKSLMLIGLISMGTIPYMV